MVQWEGRAPEAPPEDLEKTLAEVEYSGRQLGPRLAALTGMIAAAWSLFQLWIASPLPFLLNLE